MFDVVVQISDCTIRKEFFSRKQAVLEAANIIASNCSICAVDTDSHARDRLIEQLRDGGYAVLDAPPTEMPCITIMLGSAKMSVRLESDRREYNYSSIGTYSNACCRTFVDDGAWGRIAYDLLRIFCISEG